MNYKKFKKLLYFFLWLETENNVCSACGIKEPLYASIANEPFRKTNYGTWTVEDSPWFCVNCYDKIRL